MSLRNLLDCGCISCLAVFVGLVSAIMLAIIYM